MITWTQVKGELLVSKLEPLDVMEQIYSFQAQCVLSGPGVWCCFREMKLAPCPFE